MMKGTYLAAADIVGRVCLVIYYGYLILGRVASIHMQWDEQDKLGGVLAVASECAVILFLALFCATVITRQPPVRSADGVEPYLTALAGTFILGLIIYLPPPAVPAWVRFVGLVMTIAGMLLSAYVILWLGRSVSIMPEARRLVTEGPYAIVRHPLYLVEEVAVIGAILMNLSVAAVALGILQWCLQLRRMSNEERVLRAAFPDYSGYAARVPRVIPALFRSHSKAPA